MKTGATTLHPKGDVYGLWLKEEVPVVVPSGSLGFEVTVVVENQGEERWDTSDDLRLVVRLIDPAYRSESHPPYLVDRRTNFPDRYFDPGSRLEFDFYFPINLLAGGPYLLILDLVVEQKYYLSHSGGSRPALEVAVVDPRSDRPFHPRLRLPAGPSGTRALGCIAGGVPTNAFQLSSARPNVAAGSAADRDAAIRFDLLPKKVAVIYHWGQHFFRHYAHFLEFMICLHAICREHVGEVDEITIVAPDQEFSSGANPDVQRYLIGCLFGNWTVLTHVETALAGFTHLIDFNGFRQAKAMNRIMVDYAEVVGPWMDAFKHRCLAQVGREGARPDGRVAVYAKRGGGRSIAPGFEAELLALFGGFGFEVVTVDFGGLPIQSQIAVANRAAIMFGAHGNNLTNCAWLERGAALVELFPAGFHSFDFQVLCEASGCRYLGVEGKADGFVFREGARNPGWTLLGPPYNTHAHHQDGVTFVQMEVIRAFLRDCV